MQKSHLLIVLIAATAFLAGRWFPFNRSVKADTGDSPQVEVREVTGGSSLILYYPNLKKIYVYQNPFVGLPVWPCSYSVQIGTPGGTVDREPCPTDH